MSRSESGHAAVALSVENSNNVDYMFRSGIARDGVIVSRSVANLAAAAARQVSPLLMSDAFARIAQLCILLSNLAPTTFAQETESASPTTDVSGAVSVTNNGISSVPSFTLGKPAMIYDLYIRKGDLGFEPQLRWGLDGKPWVFLFWWRYRIQATDRFELQASMHPALSFTTRTFPTEGVSEDVFAVRRYLATELVPSYSFTPHVGLSSRFLFSRGFQSWTFKYLKFVSLNVTLSDISLSEQLKLSFSPQVYYLALDQESGFYFTSYLTLSRPDFPLTLSSVFTKTIETEISGGKDILWNVSLKYDFDL